MFQNGYPHSDSRAPDIPGIVGVWQLHDSSHDFATDEKRVPAVYTSFRCRCSDTLAEANNNYSDVRHAPCVV